MRHGEEQPMAAGSDTDRQPCRKTAAYASRLPRHGPDRGGRALMRGGGAATRAGRGPAPIRPDGPGPPRRRKQSEMSDDGPGALAGGSGKRTDGDIVGGKERLARRDDRPSAGVRASACRRGFSRPRPTPIAASWTMGGLEPQIRAALEELDPDREKPGPRVGRKIRGLIEKAEISGGPRRGDSPTPTAGWGNGSAAIAPGRGPCAPPPPPRRDLPGASFRRASWRLFLNVRGRDAAARTRCGACFRLAVHRPGDRLPGGAGLSTT